MSFLCVQDHRKQVETQKVEAQAFRSSVNQAGSGSNSKGGNAIAKRFNKSKDVTDTLKGKRVLDLTVAGLWPTFRIHLRNNRWQAVPRLLRDAQVGNILFDIDWKSPCLIALFALGVEH